MVARHASTLATITKKQSIGKLNNAFSTIQKLATYQLPIPPAPLPTAGGGVSVGSGTTFPILYPINEHGNVEPLLGFNLSGSDSHYQKANIIVPFLPCTVLFDGLLPNKAIVFTLDITIGCTPFPGFIWPANLYNIPSGIPTTEGSRFVLYISGFKDGTEERYEVVGVSLTGAGGSTNWSSIVIDATNINKDMRQGTLI